MLSKRSIVKLLIVMPIVWLFLMSLMIFNENPSFFNIKENENLKTHLGIKFEHSSEQTTISNDKYTSLSSSSSLAILPNISAPGELGTPVHINVSALSTIERKKYIEGWNNHSFNKYASDMISVHRSLPDIRDPLCKSLKWHEPLPTASVIVIFFNEAWSVLLRTIHSVLDRSNPKLLIEVIVVDDFSDFPHLGKPLEDYLGKLPRVKLVRSQKRGGLIKARLEGASHARGEVLIFLDSHCEASEGWLEPLLDPIARNHNISTMPLIPIIKYTDFEFIPRPHLKDVDVGGFDWKLIFEWRVMPHEELVRRRINSSIRVSPFSTPTMAGGLFAINKNYFQTLGNYDPGMAIWGGENLELSFKIWMCGGQILAVPCSQVGHVFIKKRPYSWPKLGEVITNNTDRLAEVWLDEKHKRYYYERQNRGVKATSDFGYDLIERKALRTSLKCHSFEWYLKNIYPEQYVPNGESLYYGEIRNRNVSTKCLDSNIDFRTGSIITANNCHGFGGNQYWILSHGGEIRRDDICFDYVEEKKQPSLERKYKVLTYRCHGQGGNQYWTFANNGQLMHQNSGHCIELSENGSSDVVMRECDEKNGRQLWMWKRRKNSNI